MFAQWWGEVQVQSVIFVQRLVSGTGRGFESPPLRKHKRCQQWVEKNSVNQLRLQPDKFSVTRDKAFTRTRDQFGLKNDDFLVTFD